MKTYKRGLLTLIGLIALTTAALAVMAPGASKPMVPIAGSGPVTLQAQLVQDKVLKGSQGEVAVAVTLVAAQQPDAGDSSKQPVDLVIVLDRSGSMQGEKIDAARQAARQLLERLSPQDRLALVTYANEVQLVAPLTPMDGANRERLLMAVSRIQADGGTNLGGGLQQGIDLLVNATQEGRQRKVILISDGLANHGITDPHSLGRMAASATDHHFAVSTVGVGLDFNELLMTTIADQGTGNYYFLEDPLSFARVFEKEFRNSRQAVASNVEIRLPLPKGIQLVDAGGYPIKMIGDQAAVFPGNLISGAERKLFLTFRVPADRERIISLGQIQVLYQSEGRHHSVHSHNALSVACVPDEREVVASVDRETWSEQVVRDNFSRLKEEVADDVRKGDPESARRRIQEYETRNRDMNSAVGSAEVTRHLEKDVHLLSQSVADTFAGPPAVVAEKQKKQSKVLQYESYQSRRGKGNGK